MGVTVLALRSFWVPHAELRMISIHCTVVTILEAGNLRVHAARDREAVPC